MPTGSYNRVTNNRLELKFLEWESKVKFFDGLHRTIDWNNLSKKFELVKININKKLI